MDECRTSGRKVGMMAYQGEEIRSKRDSENSKSLGLIFGFWLAGVFAASLVGREPLEELERLQAFAFSAATFEIEQRKIVVVSPLRTEGRQNSDIAHELSHIMLKHRLSEIRELNGMAFRTCKPDEEEEATNFGGTLLLPRPLLLSAVRRGATVEDIAAQYGVTTDMARFRYNLTGIAKQAARLSR